MRLIDADELTDKFLKYYTEKEKCGEFTFVACEIKQGFADMVVDAPTVEAEPVRHASWERVETDEDGYSRFRCPNCDWKTVFSRSPCRGMDDYAYCPRCGAKMDGDNENGQVKQSE